jgi:hypothetical protein
MNQASRDQPGHDQPNIALAYPIGGAERAVDAMTGDIP